MKRYADAIIACVVIAVAAAIIVALLLYAADIDNNAHPDPVAVAFYSSSPITCVAKDSKSGWGAYYAVVWQNAIGDKRVEYLFHRDWLIIEVGDTRKEVKK